MQLPASHGWVSGANEVINISPQRPLNNYEWNISPKAVRLSKHTVIARILEPPTMINAIHTEP